MDPIYSLCQELDGHIEDVRSLTSIPDSAGKLRFASASRDCTIKIWVGINENSHFRCASTLSGHSHFVHCVTFDSARNRLVSASRDHSVIIWELETGLNSVIPNAHESDVVALDIGDNGDIVTGSWDATAKVWRDGKCLYNLVGHEQAVLCCLVLPNNIVVTGSGDNLIKVWQNGQFLRNVESHTQPVRSMKLWPGVGFVSVGNDGFYRIWSFAIEPLQVVKAGDHFLYTCAVNEQSGEILTGGEEKMLRIFRNGVCVQTIQHPGTIWAITVLSNGDIVSGCSDGFVRVFTRDPNRRASLAANALFDSRLAGQNVSKQVIGDVDVDSLPPVSCLKAERGNTDGQMKIVKNSSGQGEVHSWDAANGKWTLIGHVTGDPNDNDGNDNAAIDNDVPQHDATPMTTTVQVVKAASIFDNLSSFSFAATPRVLDAVLRKLVTFNSKHCTISDANIDILKQLAATLSIPEHFSVTKISDQQFEILESIAQSWPVDDIFPALDLLRVAATHRHGAMRFSSIQFLQWLLNFVSNDNIANTQIILKLVNNLYVTSPSFMLTPKVCDLILHSVLKSRECSNKQVCIACCTIIFNFALASLRSNGDSSLLFYQQQLLSYSLFQINLLKQNCNSEHTDELLLLLNTIGFLITSVRELLSLCSAQEEFKISLSALKRDSSKETLGICEKQLNELLRLVC